MSRILIVEDEQVIRFALKRFLLNSKFTVDDCGSVDEALNLFTLTDYQLIISDLRLPGAPGTDLISRAKGTPVLIMTSYASLKSAVEVMKMGATDYIAKPFDHDEMLSTIKQIIKNHQTATPVIAAASKKTATLDKTTPIKNTFIGKSQVMRDLYKRIDKVSRTDATVLILGESGTGKELAARSIHEKSTRHNAPMISVNCAAIPDNLIESELFGHEKGAFTGATSQKTGLIEAAHGGTLFLDEIGELPLDSQARLLRFLQEGEIRRVGSVHHQKVDVRLVAATHRNLKKLSQTGQFREDLYYRLYVMDICMPPLRERREDILSLANTFLERACRRLKCEPATFTEGAIKTLNYYSWPGNVRELENAIERSVILCETELITTDLLGLDTDNNNLNDAVINYIERTIKPVQKEASKQSGGGLSLNDYFQRFVLDHQHNLNETELAKRLGVSRKCLWERRQKLGIPRKAKA
ncbi:MAG: sigma-54-dependent Fis family transcriptional regulator [Oceanospirillaceae bacterium]|nr:sigma-54-dependent Fis family transcriptional regulator [Oceanospirillaceae bacterium]